MQLSSTQRHSALQGIITLLLAVFFLYFVLVGGSCTSLLQCRIQQYVTDSLLFKHFLMFLSIMIFSFVLNWYSSESVFPQWNTRGGEKYDAKENVPLPEYQLIEWFILTIMIYVFVLLLNKCEWQYFIAVIVLLCVILGLFTFLKMYTFKYTDRMKPEHELSLRRLEHSILCVFVVLCVVLLVGVYVYYRRQSKDHLEYWSWMAFIFAGCSKKRS